MATCGAGSLVTETLAAASDVPGTDDDDDGADVVEAAEVDDAVVELDGAFAAVAFVSFGFVVVVAAC